MPGSVEYGNKKLAYIDVGPAEGPLLIFIHGWPAVGRCWQNQLTHFAAKGYRAVAPDMPGYGDSTAAKVRGDYTLESIVQGMLALLQHLQRKDAVWIGHDWGCGAVWAFAAHHPEACRGVVGMTVPYHTIERGLDALVETVDRSIYPKDEYPYGQWDYQAFYLDNFEKATAWFDSDIAGFLKAGYRRGRPAAVGKPGALATVRKDGGWLGGIPKPPPEQATSLDDTCLTQEIWDELRAKMLKTGFWGADAWYANHAENAEYTKRGTEQLHMPVLFIGANWDTTCCTQNPAIMEPMRKRCHNLTEKEVDAGHWVPLEAPDAVNQILDEWFAKEKLSPASASHI